MFFEPIEPRRMFSATVDATQTLTVTGTGRNDRIYLTNVGQNLTVEINGVSQTFDWTTLSGGVKVYGLGGKDRIDARGFRPVTQTNFKCEVYGGDGNDTIWGAETRNLFDGGRGRDVITGSTFLNADTLTYASRTRDLFIDLNDANGGSGERNENDALRSIESVWCGSGNDVVFGTDANENFDGNGGNDSLFGNGGDDGLMGRAGDDLLVGGIGNDFLQANDDVPGNDRLYGDNLDGSGELMPDGTHYTDIGWVDAGPKTVTIAGRSMTVSGRDAMSGIDAVNEF